MFHQDATHVMSKVDNYILCVVPVPYHRGLSLPSSSKSRALPIFLPTLPCRDRRKPMTDTAIEIDPKPEVRKIRVGLPGGAVHEFELPVSQPVSAIISLIREREKLTPSSTRIRIISSGKLIQDHTTPLGEILNEGDFLHASISEAPSQPEENEVPEGGDQDEGVPLMLSAVGSNGEVRIIIPNFTARGFERLSEAGFSEDEIRMIRRQFRLMRRDVRPRSDRSRENNEDTAREGTEEEEGGGDEEGGRVHLRRTVPGLVFASGAEGTNADFLLGCIIGYMVGIMVLVFLLDANATRRWRVGIVAGVATNCAFGILRTSLYVQGQSPFPGP